MFKRAMQLIRGTLSLTGYFLNTLFWAIPIILFTAFKIIIPLQRWRFWCSRVLNRLASNWVAVNRLNQTLLTGTRLEVEGLDNLHRDRWYLVLANHQSWVDILVLQNIFHNRIPFLKFFLKKELFWIPVLGQCWWALDFPFMKRYSRSFLKKNPHLKGKDLETTRQACEKFRILPVSIMNFVEGTRFSPSKRELQQSPYRHLLKTRAGGVAYVVTAMADQIDQILDVTIVYPEGVKSFWSYVCGDISTVRVHVTPIPVSPELVGDYAADRTYRACFHRWLNTLWQDKDELIEALQQGHPAPARLPAPPSNAPHSVFPVRESGQTPQADYGCA